MNRSEFLQWCADGQNDALDDVLHNSHWRELLWTPSKFDDGFGAPTQSLVEQGIEASLLHGNRCWTILLTFLAQHPEQLRGFVFGQLLYWDIDYQLKSNAQHDGLFEVFDTAFALLDHESVSLLKQSVERYCLGWGKWMVEHLEQTQQRRRIFNQLNGGADDDERKI